MEPEKKSKMKPPRRGKSKAKIIESTLSQAIHNLVPLLTQEATRFEGLHKVVADIRDELESILADDSKAEKEGEKVGYAIQDAIDEYKRQRRHRHGFTAFLQRIDLLVKKLKPGGSGGSIDCLDGSTKNLFKYAQLEFEVFNSELVKKAAKFVIEPVLLEARKPSIFLRQKRLNRNEVDNLVCTAILLASSSNSDAVVAAGLLLHAEPRYKALEKEFGTEVAKLVRDVLKLNKLSKISGEGELGNSERMPDLILAMVADARAVMIKIAERTVQMLALDTLNSKQKQRFVSETLRVYVQLAERLGFNLWKSQLENLCVSASDELKKSYESVSEYDVDGIAFEVKLREAMKEEKLTEFRIESNKKSLLRILNKMPNYRSSEKEKNKVSEDNILFSKIRDIIGLRIILENEEECYKAKDVVEKLWNAEPQFEKDFIKNPKQDGYRSLHVCVKNAVDQYMEVQIMTNEMHMASDDAHWLYKEGSLQVPEHVKTCVEFACLVNKQAKGKTTTLSNSSPHRPKCPYAKIDKPLCLDANGDCKFSGKRPVYVVVKAKNEMTIEEHSTDSKLKDLCWPEALQGQVLVNDAREGLNYTLRAGDIIEFVSPRNLTPKEEIKKRNSKLESQRRMTSSGLKFLTTESLREWLKPLMKPDDFASWGVKPGTKNTHNLWIELAEGESFLDDSTAPPRRTVSVASIRILNPTDSTKVLIESHQELSDGSVRHRGKPLAEKMKSGEAIEEAALRAVKEELGSTFSVRIVPGSYRTKTNERVSASYPGLPGSYVLHIVDAYVDGLPEGDFFTLEKGEEEELQKHAMSALHDAVTVQKHFWKWGLDSGMTAA